jgi:GMP synthase (glutamine-hydrolysing)
MDKAIILQHVEHEGPGRIVPVFRDLGIRVETRHLYRGDEVPTEPEEMGLLVVMGGPMNVGDEGNPQFPFLAQEVELLKKMIAADRAVLGICLGAQLIAHAGGAKVYAAEAGEIGWGPVTFPFPGGTEPIVYGMMDGAPMFHWHFQTFDLPKLPAPAAAAPGAATPPGNALLSSTKAVKNQAFRFKTRLFGFQYHLEMTQEGIERMIAAGKEDWEKVLGAGGAEQIRSDTKKHYAKHERLGNKILSNLAGFLK